MSWNVELLEKKVYSYVELGKYYIHGQPISGIPPQCPNHLTRSPPKKNTTSSISGYILGRC